MGVASIPSKMPRLPANCPVEKMGPRHLFSWQCLGIFLNDLESLEKMISHDCKGAVIDFNMLDHTCTQSPGIGQPGCDGFLFAAVLQTFGPCGAL